MLAFLVLWLATRLGGPMLRRLRKLAEGTREDLGTILAAALTLLGLLIGFSFSMAISHYDQRKNCEETEANAIGTAYVRADLLPAADATKLRALLREYLDQRVLFYTAREEQQLRRVNDRTAQLQTGLWSTVLAPAVSQPTAVVAMAVSGINDVLNAQGYAQAAWSNRIPLAAWSLMAAIAICCSALVGYGARNIKVESMLLPILPFIVSVSFFLIADMDSPRAGVIRVSPHNLATLVESMHVP